MARYWVGGTGNWSDTAHWAASSGGAGGETVPGTTTDVFFDEHANEATDAAYTVTVDATANCQDLTFTRAGDPSTGGLPTLSFSGTSTTINVYGSLLLVAGMAFGATSGSGPSLAFRATSGTKNITTAGVDILCSIVFNGSGGTFTFVDNLVFNNSTSSARSITLTAGTVDFTTNSVSVRLGGGGASSLVGAFTFYDLLAIPYAGVKTSTFYLSADIVVTHDLTINGNSSINRILIYSSVKGTARTITCNGTVTVTNADFQDITGAGSASWDLSAISGGSGSCGGCSGITFTTADDWYYHEPEAGANNFSTVAKWFTATNGGGSVATYPPLPQDTAIFNADSFDAGSKTIAMDMPRFGTLNTSAVDNNPAFSFNISTYFFGSITFGAHTYGNTNTLVYEGRGNSILTTNAISIPSSITINCVGGKLTLGDNLTITGDKLLTVTTGTFDSNEMIVIVPYFSSTGTGVRTIDISNSLITCNYKNATTAVWDTATVTNLTMAAAQTAGSTIKITDATSTLKIFSGGGKTFNNLWFAPGAGTGNLEVRGADTFADFKDDGTEAHSLLFIKDTTYTFTTFTISGGSAGKLKTISTVTGASDHAYFTGTGTITVDYMDIQRNQAAPANTWYYGAGSTYNSDGNCSGWVSSGATPLTAPFTDDWSNLADSIGGFRTMDASFTDDLNA